MSACPSAPDGTGGHRGTEPVNSRREFLVQRQADAVFAMLPPWLATSLRSRAWMVSEFIGSGGCRFMCSWVTTPSDVDALVAKCCRCRQEQC